MHKNKLKFYTLVGSGGEFEIICLLRLRIWLNKMRRKNGYLHTFLVNSYESLTGSGDLQNVWS